VDPELVTLASQAATTVVQLLTTDAWEKSKSAIGALWRSAHPDRADRADRLEADMADARDDLLRVPQDADLKAALIQQWTGHLVHLLTAHPELAATLRRMVDEELRPALPAAVSAQIGSLHMEAHADGGGRINQSVFGDIHTTER
jgi:hypothetical protein